MTPKKFAEKYGWPFAEFILAGIATVIGALVLNTMTQQYSGNIDGCLILKPGQTLWINASESFLNNQTIWNYTQCQGLINNITAVNTA